MNDIDILNERGYHGAAAKVMADKLSNVNPSLKSHVDEWLSSGNETDVVIYGISLTGLKAKFNLTYPAAILSMDWLIREPEKAKSSFSRGIK